MNRPPSGRGPAVLVPRPELLACDECDALYRHVALSSRQQARCARCGNLLMRGHRLTMRGVLALAVTALVVFLIANLEPVVQLTLGGARNSTTLPLALRATWDSGEHLIALLAAAVGLVFPAAVITLRLYVLWPVIHHRLPRHWVFAMRALRFASRWSMVEVLLLAALVALVRIAGMAGVVPGPGLYAFGVLALLLAALEASDDHRLWSWARPA
jgi:paraquat-inducible protein A